MRVVGARRVEERKRPANVTGFKGRIISKRFSGGEVSVSVQHGLKSARGSDAGKGLRLFEELGGCSGTAMYWLIERNTNWKEREQEHSSQLLMIKECLERSEGHGPKVTKEEARPDGGATENVDAYVSLIISWQKFSNWTGPMAMCPARSAGWQSGDLGILSLFGRGRTSA